MELGIPSFFFPFISLGYCPFLRGSLVPGLWQWQSLESFCARLPASVTFPPSFQVTYFSLWYYNKQNQRRWVDLEKPLKKQLDKHALEPTAYFGVVFYVPSVSQLQQEITR